MHVPHSDQRYVQALVSGDSNLLDEVYDRFSGGVRWMIVQNNGSEQDAADIFQEALVDIYRKAKKGFVLTCPMENFLYLICRNKWVSELRRRKKSIVTFRDDERYSTIGEDTFAQAEQSYISQKRKDLLRDKISQLGESCRKLLELSWGGKPLEEVAGLMNTSYAYVRKKKSDCVGKLVALVRNSPDYKILLY
jgi:RNA polymerase sigma factor (sigma-70 family)